jgi:RimJ/RimL family protein N-acetyltransferase
MEIFFEGIILRPWSSDDSRELARIADNKNISDNLRDLFPNPYSPDDAVKWLNMILPDNDPPKYFAIEYNNKLVGSIGIVTKADIYRKNVEIGYFLDQKYWGQGIATRAIKAVTSYAFSEFDIVRVFAEPFADNAGSIKALRKAGFRHEATLKNCVIKNGIVKDSCIYSLLLEEWNNLKS